MPDKKWFVARRRESSRSRLVDSSVGGLLSGLRSLVRVGPLVTELSCHVLSPGGQLEAGRAGECVALLLRYCGDIPVGAVICARDRHWPFVTQLVV